MAKVSFAAGVLLLGLSVSGAQAAIVTTYTDAVAWAAAAGGPVVTENFADGTLVPELEITVSVGTGFTPIIGGGLYQDRANDAVPDANNPLLTFTGLGATAFGADWDLGPNDAGTGLDFLITFADMSTMTLSDAILNPFNGLFFGIVSDMAILSIRLLEGSQVALFETFDMSNARIVSAVPIPAALPLFLSAIAALGFMGRRRKKLAAA
ncbi:MAG: VPLPA-CTERM sorting domain-containing protein [Alphaproteobacteria bacterium]